jgi:hypothetical protein
LNRKLPARTPGWTGLGFGSLPYESSLGALWRFAWFNALSGNDIAHLAYIQPGAPLNFAGPRLHALQFQRLTVATGISFPLPDEARIIARCCSLACMLRGKTWLCPLCSQGNYHSFWFQFPLLSVCPIHNIPLIDKCQNCGARTPDYELRNALSGGAWRCPRCVQPLAGIAPDLRNFVDLLDNAKFVATVFAPFDRWARRISVRGAALDRATESQVRSWRVHYQSLLLQGAVCEVRYPPGPFCRVPPLITHCLTWCERIVPQPPEPLESPLRPAPLPLPLPNPSELTSEFPFWRYTRYFDQIKPAPPKDQKYYRSRSALCYLSVLRGIRRWLIARHAIRRLDTNLCVPLEVEAGNVGVILVGGRDACETAYLLMRLLCESYPGHPGRPTVLSRPVRPEGVYRWRYANMDGTLTVRRASRAGFLALYGTLVLAINVTTAKGMLDVRDIARPASLDSALAVAWSTDYLRHAGTVLMPQVEDLLGSFPSIKSGISASWAKQWSKLQPEARRHS